MRFPEVVRWLAEQAGIVAPSGKPARPSVPSMGPRPPAAAKPAKAPAVAPEESSGLPPADALALVEAAEKRLWTPEGAEALAYLRGRGLTDETIRRHRLGWTPGVRLLTADGIRFWRALGVVIPWFDGDRLALAKIRQPEGRSPKYAEAFRDRPTLYPGLEGIRRDAPLVATEGEFDALLLGQELGELAAVVTLGSASARPEGATYLAMLPAPVWYLAHDADPAGDDAASRWPARKQRVRLPAPFKDWTEARQAGIDLRRWWVEEAFPLNGPYAGEEAAAIQKSDGEFRENSRIDLDR
jgi:DNA primase